MKNDGVANSVLDTLLTRYSPYGAPQPAGVQSKDFFANGILGGMESLLQRTFAAATHRDAATPDREQFFSMVQQVCDDLATLGRHATLESAPYEIAYATGKTVQLPAYCKLVVRPDKEGRVTLFEGVRQVKAAEDAAQESNIRQLTEGAARAVGIRRPLKLKNPS
ncbi:MAG: hypothetical protein ACAH80_17875 [Alphaproteobacteria bacterium]